MASSKVYFTDMHTCQGNNLLDKMERLLRKAGLDRMDLDGKMVAIKIHLGEPGNLAYIRPNLAAVLVRLVKEKGGKPFLTDCNTLYLGKRSNAVDHLNSAMENGFNRIAVGCDVIIADGLKGNEQREILIEQELCRTAKIGSAIADADVVISLNHFKGHELTGFGGAIKNLGMGSGSRCGKLEMHASSKPSVNAKMCVGCGQCVKSCPEKAISLAAKKAIIDQQKCVGCGQCVAICRYGAPQVEWEDSSEIVNKKIAEYAYAVMLGRPGLHINVIMDVSPNCDCWAFNDLAIVPNIGMTASKDPVALDLACADLVNASAVNRGSVLDVKDAKKGDKFKAIFPKTDWMTGVDHAQRIGLGRKEYELVRIK
jgi:hypothetical protein